MQNALGAKPTSPLIFSGAVILAALIIVAVFNSYRGVPLPVAVLARLLAAPSCLTRHTPFGVWLYAIGNNREAARRAGVLVHIIKTLAFAVLGMLTTLGGVFAVAQVLEVPPASAQFDRRKHYLSGGRKKNRISETHERLLEGISTRARIASSVAALSNSGWLVELLAIAYRSEDLLHSRPTIRKASEWRAVPGAPAHTSCQRFMAGCASVFKT